MLIEEERETHRETHREAEIDTTGRRLLSTAAIHLGRVTMTMVGRETERATVHATRSGAESPRRLLAAQTLCPPLGLVVVERETESVTWSAP